MSTVEELMRLKSRPQKEKFLQKLKEPSDEIQTFVYLMSRDNDLYSLLNSYSWKSISTITQSGYENQLKIAIDKISDITSLNKVLRNPMYFAVREDEFISILDRFDNACKIKLLNAYLYERRVSREICEFVGKQSDDIQIKFIDRNCDRIPAILNMGFSSNAMNHYADKMEPAHALNHFDHKKTAFEKSDCLHVYRKIWMKHLKSSNGVHVEICDADGGGVILTNPSIPQINAAMVRIMPVKKVMEFLKTNPDIDSDIIDECSGVVIMIESYDNGMPIYDRAIIDAAMMISTVEK